jgi:Ca2+-binding EF-hand superfamily protein
MQEKVRWVFRLYDVDGDNPVDINEILQLLKSQNSMDPQDVIKMMEVFKNMDMNGDGVLTKHEFVTQTVKDDTLIRLLGWESDGPQGRFVRNGPQIITYI